MCSIWHKYQQKPELIRDELSIANIESLLDSTRFANLQVISFTGGEPFLRKDFTDIAGIFIKKFPKAIIGVATNGLNPALTVEKVMEIEKRFKPKHFSVSLSLDGLFEKHDKIRGIKGAFKLVNETIDLLKSNTCANIGIDFTITPWNYRELLRVYNFTREKDIIFLTGFAHHSESYYGNTEMKFEWDETAMKEIASSMEKIVEDRIKNESYLRKIADPSSYYLSRCVEFQRSGDMNLRCYSGTHSLFLDPHGNIYPCIISGKKMGNIKDGFEQAWTSLKAKDIRKSISSKECRCWVACEAVPSMLRTTNFIKWNIMNKFW
jgi:MoaA/NifB/PqqE/SkfB family radical SAM enzyme